MELLEEDFEPIIEFMMGEGQDAEAITRFRGWLRREDDLGQQVAFAALSVAALGPRDGLRVELVEIASDGEPIFSFERVH